MKKTVKKYQKGGGIDDPKDKKNVSATQSPAKTLGSMSGKDYRQLKKGVKREQKLARIESGQQGERVDNVIRAVASGAEAASSAANAVKSTREAVGKMKKGGTMKKYQDGGRTISEKAAARKVAKGKGTISKSYPSGPEEKGSYVGYSKEARKSDGPWKSMKDSKPARPIMKTGGMVNSNAKVSALKSAGSKGVKSGVNPKAAASKVAKGRSGGTSTAPKTAVPKAKYGMVMRKK
jgi:hypothetical protein